MPARTVLSASTRGRAQCADGCGADLPVGRPGAQLARETDASGPGGATNGS